VGHHHQVKGNQVDDVTHLLAPKLAVVKLYVVLLHVDLLHPAGASFKACGR
jgi:hypothetical protein